MIWTFGTELQDKKYIIQHVLGQGGFGITYKALRVPLQIEVVIKTPNEYLKHDPEYDKYVDRFTREGQILARFSSDPHPNIVCVQDFFQEAEIPCLVMDFVPGENLFQLVRRRGALTEAEGVECIRQIGEALGTVHQAGLTHRDSHPGNIILQPNQQAVLIDFGIAKDLVPATLSTTGNAGNKRFAPYEQLYRGSREPKVDIYCLAATLYFLVTGKCPATSLDRKLYSTPLVQPKHINRDISNQLNRAILSGMALEAGDRPASMKDWLKLLKSPAQKACTPLPIPIILDSLPEPPVAGGVCPRRTRMQIDLLLLAIEALDVTASEAVLAAATKLELRGIIRNQASIWQMRSTNPFCRHPQRHSLTLVEAKALVLIICRLARGLTVLIRQLLLAYHQLTEKQLSTEHHFRLSEYLERFRVHYRSRMNLKRASLIAYSSDEKLNELALDLLENLLTCTGTSGVKRLWTSLFDGEVE